MHSNKTEPISNTRLYNGNKIRINLPYPIKIIIVNSLFNNIYSSAYGVLNKI